MKRRLQITNGVRVLGLVLLPVFACFSVARADFEPAPDVIGKQLIEAKAALYKMGKPRPETPVVMWTPNKRGMWQAFEGGWIYFSAQSGTHIVKGKIFEEWGKMGWENGLFGFPISDEMSVRSAANNTTLPTIPTVAAFLKKARSTGIVLWARLLF